MPFRSTRPAPPVGGPAGGEANKLEAFLVATAARCLHPASVLSRLPELIDSLRTRNFPELLSSTFLPWPAACAYLACCTTFLSAAATAARAPGARADLTSKNVTEETPLHPQARLFSCYEAVAWPSDPD